MTMQDMNQRIIAEFRANEGRVGGALAGRQVLLLTTTGAKSGRRGTTPLGYLPEGDRMLVFASNLGAPRHPAWYWNLLANPRVTVEVGTEASDAIASALSGEERKRAWSAAVEVFPFLVEHQSRTTRQIPIVALVR